MEHFNSMTNPNYTEDLKQIKNVLDELANIVSDIKTGIVNVTKKVDSTNQMTLDLNLPNVTTTYSDYQE